MFIFVFCFCVRDSLLLVRVYVGVCVFSKRQMSVKRAIVKHPFFRSEFFAFVVAKARFAKTNYCSNQ